MFENKLRFFTSTRFWQFGLAIGIALALSNGYVDSASIQVALTFIAALSGTAATVGTVDRFGESIGGGYE